MNSRQIFLKQRYKNLPRNWRVVPFNEVLHDISAGKDKLQKSEYLESGSIPIIDQGKERIAGYSNNQRIKTEVKVPLILFGDHTRVFKYVDFDFIIGADGVRVLQPKEFIDTKFIYYFLKQLRLPDKGYSRHFKYLKEEFFLIPPESIQKSIVRVFDKIEFTLEKRRQTLRLADEFLKSVFLEMFGDPIGNQNKWPKKTLEDVCKKITDGEHATPQRIDKGIKLLSARNVKNGYIDVINESVDYIPESEFERIKKRCHPELGDVLLSCSGSIGRVARVKTSERFSLVRSVALMKPSKDLVKSEYLEAYLQTAYVQSLIDRSANKSSQANIFLGPIKKLPIILPPINFQNKFADLVQKVERLKEKQKQSETQLQDLFNSLMQRAFKGELVGD